MKRGTVTTTAVLVGLVLIAAGVLVVSVGNAFSNQSPSPSGDMLVTENRDRLRICLQAVDLPGFDSVAGRQRISQALSDVARHSRWAESGYARAGGPQVEVGCSTEPYLLRSGVTVMDGVPAPGPAGLIIPKVEQPSAYRLFVFVLPEEKLAPLIKGGAGVRTAAQEALCQEHTCFTVTTGVYLSESELNNRSYLAEWLTKGLNLERPVRQEPGIFQTPGNRNSPKP